MATSKIMRAIRVSEFGAPSVLKLCTDLPVPNLVRNRWVLEKNLDFLITNCFKL